jgi:hypothetical protein
MSNNRIDLTRNSLHFFEFFKFFCPLFLAGHPYIRLLVELLS